MFIRWCVSRMPTVLSLSYSDLTHAVSLTHGRSLPHAISLAHVVSFTRGASSTHGVLGSTHFDTLANTPFTHGVSFTLGVALTHALAPTLCARAYGGETRDRSYSFLIPDRPHPVGEGGCGLEREVAWRGSDAKGWGLWSVSRREKRAKEARETTRPQVEAQF